MNDALTLAAAAFVGLATPARGGERPALAAAKAVRPPTIDGQIDPDEWKNAAVARGFRQLEPRRGEAATTDTEALVLYDERSLYVVFRAADDQGPRPSSRSATPTSAARLPEVHRGVRPALVPGQHGLSQGDSRVLSRPPRLLWLQPPRMELWRKTNGPVPPGQRLTMSLASQHYI